MTRLDVKFSTDIILFLFKVSANIKTVEIVTRVVAYSYLIFFT